MIEDTADRQFLNYAVSNLHRPVIIQEVINDVHVLYI